MTFKNQIINQWVFKTNKIYSPAWLFQVEQMDTIYESGDTANNKRAKLQNTEHKTAKNKMTIITKQRTLQKSELFENNGELTSEYTFFKIMK